MRKILLVIMVWGASLSCFSQERLVRDKVWEEIGLFHYQQGFEKLLAHEPLRALEDFQKAHLSIATSSQGACTLGGLFFLSQAVAYDVLGYRDHCLRALGELLLLGGICNLEDDDDDESSEEDEQLQIEYVRQLADFTPSDDIKKLLLSILDLQDF